MRLSEAIRLGAMMRPQGRGAASSARGTCALGAALEAVGGATDNGWFQVYDVWPVARTYMPYPGDSHHGEMTLVGSCCWILNDCDHWTREQIADWVEGVERAAAEPAPTAVAVGEAVDEPVAVPAHN